MSHRFSVAFTLLVLTISLHAQQPAPGTALAEAAIRALTQSRAKIAEVLSVPKPIRVVPGSPGVARVTQPSTSIGIHLSSLLLGNGARLTLLDPAGATVWSTDQPTNGTDVWLPPVPGQAAHLRCDAESATDCTAIIDKIARGFSPKKIRDENEASVDLRQICGSGCELRDTICPQLPPALSVSKNAVVRLIISGTESCTGFLVGDLGHMLTNMHCIADTAAAQHVVYEFGAEEFTCPATVDCTRVLKAPPRRVERGATVVDKDVFLDVAVVQLPKIYAEIYGFLQLRKTGPTSEEGLAIVQHPRGESRKFAVNHILPIGGQACATGLATTVAYNADTLFGSSGSPVISLAPNGDHAVIALHQCVGCPNRGISSALIATRFQNTLPASAFTP